MQGASLIQWEVPGVPVQPHCNVSLWQKVTPNLFCAWMLLMNCCSLDPKVCLRKGTRCSWWLRVDFNTVLHKGGVVAENNFLVTALIFKSILMPCISPSIHVIHHWPYALEGVLWGKRNINIVPRSWYPFFLYDNVVSVYTGHVSSSWGCFVTFRLPSWNRFYVMLLCVVRMCTVYRMWLWVIICLF